MYAMLLHNSDINIKKNLRKIIHFQKQRINILTTFTRFPNRNKLLKRYSTIEETDYLDEMEYNELKLIF